MTTPSALVNPNFTFLIPGTSTSGYFVIPCIPGGSITQYKVTYTDSTAGTANPNKIALDANGEAPVWGTGFYKMYVTTPGGTTVYSVDNWSAQGSITGGILEFIPQSNAFTYAAANQFSMVGDGTLTFQVNRRVQAQVTAGTIYGSITASSYAAGITTVTVLWDAGASDSGLSTVSVGIISVTNQSLPINGLTMNITGTASNLSAPPIPWSNVTGATTPLYSFSTNGTGCTLTYTVSSGAINSITAIAAAGSGYEAGDVLTVNLGGKNSYIRVLTLSGSGVATVEILYGGTGYAGATGAATVPATVNFNTITLAGVLTQGITIIMPYNNPLEWAIANNTTGAFTTTVKISNSSDTAIGTGVQPQQGSGNSTITRVYTDGLTDVWFTLSIANSSTNIFGGSANKIPYQTAANTTSFISPVASALLVTDGSGVPSESTAIPNGVTAATQSPGDNTTKLATTAFVSVASSPTAIAGSTSLNKLRSMTIKFGNTAASTGAGCTLNWTASGGVVQPTPTVNNGGTSGTYAIGDVLSIMAGTNRATCRVATLSGSQVATVTLLQGGTGYGASGTGTVTVNNIYQSITTVQNNSTGMGFNVSGISTAATVYLCAAQNGAGGVVTSGSGATLLSFQFADGTTAKQLQITTSETITEILGIFQASDAQPPVGLGYLFSGSLSSGSMILNIYGGLTSACTVWSSNPSNGNIAQFNILYVVGGAA